MGGVVHPDRVGQDDPGGRVIEVGRHGSWAGELLPGEPLLNYGSCHVAGISTVPDGLSWPAAFTAAHSIRRMPLLAAMLEMRSIMITPVCIPILKSQRGAEAPRCSTC